MNDIKNIVNSEAGNSQKTFILQKYIEAPALYKNRKFDIRCFALISSINGHLKGYNYLDGYLRTSGREFNLKNLNKYIHLTNDAVQKQSEDYGKFEFGNKVSFSEYQQYLN
jgi:tubulin---tyrosine ligase